MVQNLVRCARIYASEIYATVEPTIGRCITLNTVQDVLVALQELMIGSRTPPRYLHSSHFKAATLILRVLAMYSFDKRVMASLACAAIIVIGLFIVRAAFRFIFLSFI
jgi:hypothetical protein